MSDTIMASATPWFEEYVPKPWSEYPLPGDIPAVSSTWNMGRIWDENYNSDGFHSNEQTSVPHHITWDFGRTVKLSRLTYWPRNYNNGEDRWARGHAKVFEIWGTPTPPNPDGSFDGWTLLGRFECVKPSGPGAQITQEDVDFALAGIEFDFVINEMTPDAYLPVRFIRWRTISTFHTSNVSPVHILELSFWGELMD